MRYRNLITVFCSKIINKAPNKRWYNDYVRNLKTVDQQTKEDQIKNYFDFHKELEG